MRSQKQERKLRKCDAKTGAKGFYEYNEIVIRFWALLYCWSKLNLWSQNSWNVGFPAVTTKRNSSKIRLSRLQTSSNITFPVTWHHLFPPQIDLIKVVRSGVIQAPWVMLLGTNRIRTHQPSIYLICWHFVNKSRLEHLPPLEHAPTRLTMFGWSPTLAISLSSLKSSLRSSSVAISVNSYMGENTARWELWCLVQTLQRSWMLLGDVHYTQ